MGIKKDLNKPDITLSNMAVFTQPVYARAYGIWNNLGL